VISEKYEFSQEESHRDEQEHGVPRKGGGVGGVSVAHVNEKKKRGTDASELT